MRRIGFFDFGALFDAKGHLKPIRHLAPEARAVLASVEVVRRNITVGDGKRLLVRVEDIRALRTIDCGECRKSVRGLRDAREMADDNAQHGDAG